MNYYDPLGTDRCVCITNRVRGDKHVCYDPERQYIVNTDRYKYRFYESLASDEEFVELTATIAGESLGCSKFEIQACTQVVLNRVGNPTWDDYGNESIIGVVSAGYRRGEPQFGGYKSNIYAEMKEYISLGMPDDFVGIYGRASDYNVIYNNTAIVYTGSATNYVGNATMFCQGGKPKYAGKEVFIPGESVHRFFVNKNDVY